MDDHRRILERKALRNVRVLFERLERDDLGQRRRQWYLLAIALLPVLVVLGIVLATRPSVPAVSKSCELNAWNVRAAEFERSSRQSNPEMSYQQIQKQLERERPFFMAAARVDCDSKAR
jgi:hypothetical protein